MFLSKEERLEQERAREEAKLKAVEDEKKRRAIVNKIIVTTGDLKEGYEIIGPVFFEYTNANLAKTFHPFMEKYEREIENIEFKKSERNLKGNWNYQYGKHCLEKTQNEKAFYVGVEQLKERAYLLGGDAVISMKQEFSIFHNGFIIYYYVHFYGTAVRLKQDVFENE